MADEEGAAGATRSATAMGEDDGRAEPFPVGLDGAALEAGRGAAGRAEGRGGTLAGPGRGGVALCDGFGAIDELRGPGSGGGGLLARIDPDGRPELGTYFGGGGGSSDRGAGGRDPPGPSSNAF